MKRGAPARWPEETSGLDAWNCASVRGVHTSAAFIQRSISMQRALIATVLGTIALFAVSGSASADDIDDYRVHNSWQYPRGPNCRVVEVHTTNRWGNDVTIHRRVCD